MRDAPASRPLALGDALLPSRRLSMPHPCVADGRQYRDGGNAGLMGGVEQRTPWSPRMAISLSSPVKGEHASVVTKAAVEE